MALLANITLVPKIADSIADSTSTWQRWSYDDYPIERCLETMDYSLAGYADDGKTIEELIALLYDMYGGSQATANALAADISNQKEDSSIHIAESADERELLESLSDEQLDPESTWLALWDEDGKLMALNLRSLQAMAIWRTLESMGIPSDYDWQILQNDDAVMVRNLSVYHDIRQLKYPIAIGIYLIGCIVLVSLCYGRAMRYFDELTECVEDLVKDREKPVVLPKDLAMTENELNSIRIASLADERAAKLAERRKDELVAYLAHDVRTPLTSVMGYLMLLEEAPDMPDEQRQRFVHIAASKAERLELLINEFFEITRYNLQSMPIERKSVDMRLLIEQVTEEFFPDADARGIRLDVKCGQDISAFLDPDKFARALGNVVRNAVSYADEDTVVTISAKVSDDTWVIEVSNSGREISEAHLEAIFEKFYREDASRGSKSGGAGLGLAIAKEIVIAHGGTIEAASEHGRTTFTIKVPVP